MADYLTTDTELTSVADAIRAKGGTSDSLTYPDGFVSAIEAIPTGGGGVETARISVSPIDGRAWYTNANMEVCEPSMGEMGYYIQDDAPIGSLVVVFPPAPTITSRLTLVYGSSRTAYIYEVTG